MTPPELAYIVELEEQIKQQAAVVEQMRELIKRLVDATPGHAGQCSGLKCREPYCYSCNDEEAANEYLQSVWNLCGEANAVILALQPCPEVLNKVRADAVRKFAEDELDNPHYSAAMNYAQRIEKGEA